MMPPLLTSLQCLFLLAVTFGNDIPLCPPAKEGSTYNLTYTGQMPQKPYFIEWLVKNSSTELPLTLCDWLIKNCEASSKEYQITNNHSGDQFSSHLTFTKVGSKHRDLIVTLKTWVLSTDIKESVMRCKMAVYSMSQNTSCSVSVMPNGKIRLYCENPAVYPGIACEFIERINNADSGYNQTMSNKREIVQGNPYFLYKGSCEAYIFPLRKGTYSYSVRIRLGDGFSPTSFGDVLTNSVPVDQIPDVRVEQREPTYLCPNATVAKVSCTASWFESRPKFQLFIDGQKWAGAGNLVGNGGRKYTMTYNVPISRSLHRAMMMCIVGDLDSLGEFRGLNDTKRLEFDYPPEPPVFRSQAGHDVSIYFDIIKGENVTLRCEVDGGQPKVTSMNVTCIRNGRVNYTLVTNSSNQISFVVHGNDSFRGVYCFCYPRHPAPCYKEWKAIYFLVKARGQQQREEKAEGANKMTPIYYIVVVTLGLIFLPIIVGTGLYIRKYGTGLYTYYYQSFVYYSRKASAPPLPPPRIPPRPSAPPLLTNGHHHHHHRSHDSTDPVTQVSVKDDDWMEDPDTALLTAPHPGEAPRGRRSSERKKRKKKVKASDSVASDDYLIPFVVRRKEDSSNQGDSPSDTVTFGNEDYMTMQFRKGVDSSKVITSMGFAPSKSPPKQSAEQPPRALDEADLDKTGVKTTSRTPNGTDADTDNTKVKRVSLRRHSPLRYVKIGGKTGPSHGEQASGDSGVEPGEARPESPASSWVDTSLSDMGSRHEGGTSGDESDVLVDVANLDLPRDRNRHADAEDFRGSGEFVPTFHARAQRTQNIYVENSEIY